MADKIESDAGAGLRPGRDLQAAFSFLTRIPVGHSNRPLARAAYLFPVVGIAVGALGGAVFWAAMALGLGPWIAALLALAATAVATGGLHEDGLADCADGFGGGATPDRRLEIMRDPRSGAFGVLALVFATGLKAAALAQAGSGLEGALMLLAAHAGARGFLPVVMWRLPTARATGLAASAGRPDGATALIALALGVAAVLVLLPGAAPGMLVAAAATVLAMCWLARRLVGGYNGDVLGALEQCAELGLLLAAAAALGE